MSRKSKRWIRKGFYFHWSSTQAHWWIWSIHSTYVAARGPQCIQEQNMLSKSVPSTTMRGQLWLPMPMPCMNSKPRNPWRHALPCLAFRRLSIPKISNFFANKWLIESIELVWLCFILAPRWCPGFPQLSRAYLWSGRWLAQMKVWTVCRQTCDSQHVFIYNIHTLIFLSPEQWKSWPASQTVNWQSCYVGRIFSTLSMAHSLCKCAIKVHIFRSATLFISRAHFPKNKHATRTHYW